MATAALGFSFWSSFSCCARMTMTTADVATPVPAAVAVAAATAVMSTTPAVIPAATTAAAVANNLAPHLI